MYVRVTLDPDNASSGGAAPLAEQAASRLSEDRDGLLEIEGLHLGKLAQRRRGVLRLQDMRLEEEGHVVEELDRDLPIDTDDGTVEIDLFAGAQ